MRKIKKYGVIPNLIVFVGSNLGSRCPELSKGHDHQGKPGPPSPQVGGGVKGSSPETVKFMTLVSLVQGGIEFRWLSQVADSAHLKRRPTVPGSLARSLARVSASSCWSSSPRPDELKRFRRLPSGRKASRPAG